MFKNSFLTVLFTIIIFSGLAKAQSAGINFSLAFPMGDFKDNLAKTGIGLAGNFNILTPAHNLPVGLGLNFGYYNYGSESRREPFSSTIPDVTVDVDRTNNLANFHFVFQFGLPSGVFRPYVEGLFGGNYLFTDTKITSRGSEEVASSTNFDDYAWSYGGGGGFMIELSRDVDENVSSLFLDFKVRYLAGSKAEYLKEGSVLVQNGKVTYQTSKSKTDILSAHLGVVIFFNRLF